MTTPYRGYDVLGKWNTPSFDDLTRKVLARRLEEVPRRCFFTEEELRLLDAIVSRLAPDFGEGPKPPIALWIDERLHAGKGEGFRPEGVPPMREGWRQGLLAIAGEATRRFSAPFISLEPSAMDAVLRAVQKGDVDRALWRGLDPVAFFSSPLLKTIVGLAYSHPSAWNDIGFGGPASPRGYVRLGFDERDPWEARES